MWNSFKHQLLIKLVLFDTKLKIKTYKTISLQCKVYNFFHAKLNNSDSKITMYSNGIEI